MNPRSLALAALLALAGCGEPTAPAPAVTIATSPAFGGTDRAWIEINIAMNEQLLPLLDLVPPSSSLHAASEQVRLATEAELAELRRLHTEAGLPAENQHKGMPMPGMVEPSTVASAAALRGKTFDTLLREQLRAHLEQGRKLAEGERSAGVEPRTVALAGRIFSARQAALSLL